MKGKYQLLCMSFDGSFVIERPVFDSIEEAWEYSDDLGSKWYFYPFHFVFSGRTIKDTDERISYLKERRIRTVQKLFEKAQKFCEKNKISCDAEEFILYL